MKTIRALLWSTAVLFLAFGLNPAASANPLYGATLSASLTTQVSATQPTYTVHTVPINNSTIINAIYESGTSGAAKKSDLALAISNGTDLAVINKTATSGSNIVAVIGTSGTNSVSTDIVTGKGNLANLTAYESDYEFTLPTVSPVQVTNARVKAKLNFNTETVTGLMITFGGGSVGSGTGTTLFQGTITQTSKIYP